MILVNTLLFADGWASPFDPADNQAWVFRAPGGEKPMTMMRQTLPAGRCMRMRRPRRSVSTLRTGGRGC